MAKLPVLIISKGAILPTSIQELDIKKDNNLLVIKESIEKYSNELIIISAEKESNTKSDTFSYGTIAKIIKINDETNVVKVLVEGIKRILVKEFKTTTNTATIASYILQKETKGSKKTIDEIREVLTLSIEGSSDLDFEISPSEILSLKELPDNKFIDRVANLLSLTDKQILSLLVIKSVEERYIFTVKIFSNIVQKQLVNKEQEIVQTSVNDRVKKKISSQQKEFYLKEQLKAIKDELDELGGIKNEFEEYKKRVSDNPYPGHIKKKILYEIKKLESTPSQAQEANIIRTYID